MWEIDPGYCKHVFLVASFKIQCVQCTNDLWEEQHQSLYRWDFIHRNIASNLLNILLSKTGTPRCSYYIPSLKVIYKCLYNVEQRRNSSGCPSIDTQREEFPFYLVQPSGSHCNEPILQMVAFGEQPTFLNFSIQGWGKKKKKRKKRSGNLYVRSAWCNTCLYNVYWIHHKANQLAAGWRCTDISSRKNWGGMNHGSQRLSDIELRILGYDQEHF